MNDKAWYAVVFVERGGRLLTVSKHGHYTAAVEAAEYWTSKDHSIQIIQRPAGGVVWDSNDG